METQAVKDVNDPKFSEKSVQSLLLDCQTYFPATL
jgi:hypothetical protein